MQEPSWIFILFTVTIALVAGAAMYSYLSASNDQDKGVKSKLGNK